MPKELTHIAVSELALRKVEACSPDAGETLRRQGQAYILGSLICDSAYYGLPFGEGRKIAFLSRGIHTRRGELDYAFFERLLRSALPGGGAPLFAFACGVLSHHLADGALHPLVIYLTGNYNHAESEEMQNARARHRYLEGLVDCRVAAEMIGAEAARFRLGDYLALEYAEMEPLLALFISAVRPGPPGRQVKALFKALSLEAAMTGRYSSPFFRGVVLSLNRLFGGRLKAFAALCYPGEKSRCEAPLLGHVDYRDPFSGEERSGSFGELISEAADRLSSLIIELYKYRGNPGRAVEAVAPFFHPGEGPDECPKFLATPGNGVESALRDFLGTR